MASLPIHWILARTYCQVTEDEDRVAAALETAAPGGTLSRDTLTGQFGNPVVVLTRRLERAEDLRAAWVRWGETGILAGLAGDVDARVDEAGVLHFRLDKQRASGGELAVHGGADTIDIQVKAKAYPAKPEEIRKVARALVAEAV